MSEHLIDAEASSPQWFVRWGRSNERPVKTRGELQEILDSLHLQFSTAPEPVLAEIEGPTGDSLAIGLGRELSVLNFISASREPPYFTSVGSQAPTGEVAVFRFGDEWTEIPAEHLIPVDVAREAAYLFFETLSRPDSVEWAVD